MGDKTHKNAKNTQKEIENEFDSLERKFPWSNEGMIRACREMNIYSDVAPYMQSAVFVMRGKTRE